MSHTAPRISPVRFHCEEILRVPRRDVFDGLVCLEKWKSFRGYGPLPGIREANFLLRNEEITGSIIRVESTDGSVHQERFLEWLPEERVVIELSGFSHPLSVFAVRFVEEWSFIPDGDTSRVRRSVELFPVNEYTRPVLWLISLLLRRAISSHLKGVASGIGL